MRYNCAQCGKECDKPTGHVNRARERGLNLYCGRVCSGLGRRRKVQPTKDELIERKRLYDIEYRAKNLARIKADKAAYYAANHDRDKEQEYRQRTMARHVEYCRRPEYRAYKQQYDRQYRARQEYGEFWESFLLTQQIHEAAVEKAGGWYELALMKGTLNKAIQRRRDYERLDREEPEAGALGNIELGERR